MNPESIVVIGAGLAAATCITELRSRGYTGSLHLVGDEQALPYERPPLSKGYLQGNDKVEDFTVNPAAWYAENNVDVRLDTRAISIDAKHQQVALADGTTLGYDALVLATGARSNIGGAEPFPGHDLPGVHTLRSLADADALKAAITHDTQLAVIGSGWIGMEVAASARSLGARVTVYSPDEVPLAKVFGERFGHHLLELHKSHGVDVRTGTRVQGIEPGERGLQVISDAGSFRADLVLLAIGAVPNVELAETAGLEVDRGVVVDASLRSSNSKILAIGDVAQAFNTRLRRQLRVEHWDNAIRQGKLAAATLTGAEEAYDWLPYFFTDQYDLGMEYVGDAAPGDQTVLRGDEHEFIIFWLREGRITAAANVNIWDVNDTLRALVGREIPAARLEDPSIELGEL
ncbi:pyridine nucleotide-disulfide oxidoreductase [Glutamicibacter uratoxydans]|uniref:Pyridine nucleotide-disulfide oxidoreductase n=1 Tax=Glutamicibacter uratoxydans TaxID=43667 RepID=A0A4Y4DQQ0_GLUUR|nr:FAD/NAD(P)-binding oxidoreductase [Glutamicibacter uratoxydans]GED07266.1 pyridine nucleotide-disulfide oxidoreductase [Glutamicibacter uratoxydans]